ncbi:MAG TPA: TetR/AcrR family transcriptional regulator [Solirubrobacterales bacterium]|nr:TetR/AcrR family transcriptional regulator [Solirubrobacterales bacterium]
MGSSAGTKGIEGRRLPRGSHGIPAAVVARNQRERLVAAIAEVCAEVGYAEATVAGVAKRAGVSSLTFYEQFAGKRDCLLAAHRQLLGRLLEEVDLARGAESEPGTQVRVAIRTALALLAADPPSAQLLTVEILAAGPGGARRHDAMVEAFASRLRAATDPSDDALLTNTDWMRVAGMLALVGKLVVAGEASRLPELEEELVAMVSPRA